MYTFLFTKVGRMQFLNLGVKGLKPTAMKRLGIAHSTILDFAMKTQACRNYQESASY